MLGAEYLQRFREAGDLNDVARAAAMANRSLRLQPWGNPQALSVLAASDVTLHRFAAALTSERAALQAVPFDDSARAQTASILMEMGRYEQAARVLAHPAQNDPNPTWMSIRARYDELTGNLAGARVQMAEATALVDRMLTVPAYTRSWYHVRDAQLAFEAGDEGAAGAEFAEALRVFPDNAMAWLFQAKLYRAQRDWVRTLDVGQAQRRPVSASAGARIPGGCAARAGRRRRRAQNRRPHPCRAAPLQRARHQRPAARNVLRRASRALR